MSTKLKMKNIPIWRERLGKKIVNWVDNWVKNFSILKETRKQKLGV